MDLIDGFDRASHSGSCLDPPTGKGCYKYGLNVSSSQLGIKSLGTRVLRVDGHGFRSCIVVCCVFCA